mgnify:CR=1 FL=1
MRFVTRFFGLDRAAETRSAPSISDLVATGHIPPIGPGLHGDLATSTTDDEALTVAAVFACVSLIADVIASLPVDAFAPAPSGGFQELDPRPAWLDRPNDLDEWPEVASMLAVSLLLHGNAYMSVTRTADGAVQALHVLDPARVSPVVKADGSVVFNVDGTDYDRRTILHIPGLRKPGCVEGMSPLTYARSTIATGLAAQRFGAAYLKNGGFVASHIEVPGAISDAGIRQMKEAWDNAHAGANKAGKLAILTEGAKFVQHNATPADAQLLDVRRFTVEDVARIYRVPTYLIAANDQATSWGAGVAEQGRAFGTYTLQPWTTRIEARLSALLHSEGRPGAVKFNLDALVRSNIDRRYAAYKTALDAGFLTVDEVRGLEDLGPLPTRPAPSDPPHVA